jgi:hypothetical protein
MSAEFNIEARWPELFAPLSETERRAIVNTLASGWHEGWTPNRADVADLIDVTRGVIDEAEYRTRTADAIARDRAHAIAG